MIAAQRHPMPLPYVVKPVDEGSSVGVYIVDERSNGPGNRASLNEREIFGDTCHGRKIYSRPRTDLRCHGRCGAWSDRYRAEVGTSMTMKSKYAAGRIETYFAR